jgi:Protein of unknown function (DUF1064)
MQPRNKYRNVPTLVDGRRFSSKAEAARYQDLRLMQRAGEIDWFILQPRFDLGDGITYVADFLVVRRGLVSVEDVKGVETAAFKLKRKLFESKYQPLNVIKGKRRA